MVRRISVAVLTAALMLVAAATPAAASPMVVSTWEAVDIDGSNLSLVVYADGWTYGLDDDTSVCGGGMAKIYGPGTLDRHQNLTSADLMASCASGPLLGPFHVAFWTGTPPLVMRDSLGVTWYRTG